MEHVEDEPRAELATIQDEFRTAAVREYVTLDIVGFGVQVAVSH